VQQGSILRAPGLRIRSPDTQVQAADNARSPLPGARPQRLADCLIQSFAPFPWDEIHALGLQSYSRGLCLSRDKHHMLYPQQ
jgi:hypothetical protein